VTSLSGVYIVYSRNERLLNGRLWREAALRKAQAELARVTRVTTLGELTASIAHEVNQPLATVVTFGDASLRWLDREVPRIDKARSAVEQMIGSARHASDVIQRIRALSKKGAFESVRLDINQVIDDVIALIRGEINVHGISLRLELGASLPPVDGDRIQLQQVIVNLLMNGIQAMSAVQTAIANFASDRASTGPIRYSSRWRIPASESNRNMPPSCSAPSSRRSRMAWAWDYRSAVRLSKPTVANCGPRQTYPTVPRFS
jgi:signal transduction histidine kinase